MRQDKYKKKRYNKTYLALAVIGGVIGAWAYERSVHPVFILLGGIAIFFVIRRVREWQAGVRQNIPMKTLAEKGNADAQYRLGKMYFHGTGVPKDEHEAVKWFQKAAAQGNEYAREALRRLD